MEKALKFVLIVLLAGLSVCMVADYFLQRALTSSKDDVMGKLNKLIKDTDYYDILCLGSSRTLAHFNPAVIEQKTGLSTYNAGLNGANLVDFTTLFKAYLAKHPAPKFVILHVDDFTFESHTLTELPRYFPFVSDTIIYNSLVKYDRTLIFIKYLPFLRLTFYTDLQKWIGIKSMLGIKMQEEYRMVNGYRTNRSEWNSFFEERYDAWIKKVKNQKSSEELEKDGEYLFNTLLTLCKKHNIHLILTSSPMPGGDVDTKYQNTVMKCERLAASYDVSFFWNHEKQWDRTIYYYDHLHMNYKGADRYSQELADFINKEISNP